MMILNMFLFFQSDVWLGCNIDFKIMRGFFEERFLSFVLYCMAFYSVSHVVCLKEENWNAVIALWAKHLFGP